MTEDFEADDRRLHALPETMRAFAEATTDYRRLLNTVAEQMALLIGDGSFVALLSDDQTELQPVSVHFRDAATTGAARKFLAGGPIRVDGPSLGARVVRTRTPVLGQILFVNDGGRLLVGLDRDTDLSTLRLTDFHTDDGMKRAPVIRQTGRWEGPGQLRHFKTGELVDTQVSSFLVRDPAGQPVGYGTVQHDMRETKRLESQLRQAQKMEAIGTLAAGIAHDFNNILGAILGNLQIARVEVGPGHAAQNRFDEIASAGRRAVALVRQILTFGRQREASKRIIRLEEVVKEAVALLRSTLSANIELVTSIASDTPNISADPTQIHQIILNLATNAWHAFEGRGGRIGIDVSAVPADENVSPSSSGPTGPRARPDFR